MRREPGGLPAGLSIDRCDAIVNRARYCRPLGAQRTARYPRS